MEEKNHQYKQDTKKNNFLEKTCPSCSTKIDLADSFCPECGTKIIKEFSLCRICSTVCDGFFCGNCGANQESNQCLKC